LSLVADAFISSCFLKREVKVGIFRALYIIFAPPSENHYYRLRYHCCHFHCHSDRSNGMILPPLVGPIVRPPKVGNWQLKLLPPTVNKRCGSGIFSIM
jgi:hypothetical protein